MMYKKIDWLIPKNVKEKVISKNGSKKIIFLEKDRKKNPAIEDVFVFGFNKPNIFKQCNGKRYKTFGAIFSPEVLKNKDLDKVAELFFSTQEKKDIRELRKTTQRQDGMFDFSSENKANIKRWIKKVKKSDAKAIKIVLDMHGDEDGYLENDVSRELLYLLNKIAGDKDLCKKNIEIVNKACYAADKFEENTMISRYNPQIFHITHKTANLMQILTNFARKVKKQSPQTNIVYTSNFSKTETHDDIWYGDNVIKNEKLQNFIYHANALNHYHKYDPEKKCFIPISKTLDSFYQKDIYDNNYLKSTDMQDNNESYKKLMINFNVLTSLNRCLLEENKPNNELKTFLEEIESECVKKIPNKDTINFFLPRINVFLNKYRLPNLSNAKTYHHIKNLRSYELFFPEDIVKEMQNAKQLKNDLLLGNKKDVEILNDLNKINPSNKMNKNKKTHKRSNVFANMNISAKKANKTSEKMFNPLLEFGISPEEANKGSTDIKYAVPECEKEDRFRHLYDEEKNISNAQNKYNQVYKKKVPISSGCHKNKINPSNNKMDENKKNSNHTKEQKRKYIHIDNYIKEQKRKKTNAYINLDNHMLGKSNDNKILS